MSARYYGLLLGVAASISLVLAGCSSDRAAKAPAIPATGQSAAPNAARQATTSESDDTDATLWTVLGLAKRQSQRNIGPQTGDSVSPELWQATQDTLHFAGTGSEDPMTGLLMTQWYSPPVKPNERLRVSVFILSRALRSDSVAVTVERQVRAPAGAWQDTPVARDVVAGIENAILQRAQQIHAGRYRDTMYN